MLSKTPAAFAPEPRGTEAPLSSPPHEASATVIQNADPFIGLFGPAFCQCEPVAFAQGIPNEAKFEPIAPENSQSFAVIEDVKPETTVADLSPSFSAPLPEPRPEFRTPQLSLPLHAPGRPRIEPRPKAAVASTGEDHRSFFEKLFGLAPHPNLALAYAAPETALVNRRNPVSGAAPNYDRFTAVYDVAAHTVYMPDGTRLEAHSGLGNMLDDPRYVSQRNRGATPPNIYELEPREQLFHGVQALRLKPIGGGEVYGRTGLLAHTYMLGPNGDSNGCVSFRNYRAFLQAYQNGEIRHLVVVARTS